LRLSVKFCPKAQSVRVGTAQKDYYPPHKAQYNRGQMASEHITLATHKGFPEVADVNARVLILGTLPGTESLRRGEYYAKTQNSFWRIMDALVGAGLEKPYAERLRQLKTHGIALWDVCASAERVGSLDARINFPTIIANDFRTFFANHPHISLICFNGQPAERLFLRTVLSTLLLPCADIRCETLPSTSPAHARMRFEEKLAIWKAVLGDFVTENDIK
jgi:hypoxanthine-DNA glycosylase